MVKQVTHRSNFELFQRILDEGAEYGVYAAKLQVRGESMRHLPPFRSRSLCQRGIIDLQLTTNAMLIGREGSRRLLGSGLGGIIFSCDRHHRDGYDGEYEQDVGGNIDTFLRERAARGGTTPWVRLQTALDEDEINRWADREKQLRSRFPLADFFAMNRLQEYRYDRPCYPDLTTAYELLPCPYPNQRLLIYCDGRVTVCCMDYECRFALGDLSHRSLFDIWNSSELAALRRIHLAGNRTALEEACAHCHVAVRRKH